MKKLCIMLVKFYRKFLSPLKPPCCRFVPTCSQYSIEAFNEWGFLGGAYLTLMRILRCHPFCRGGFDPVPINKRKRKKRSSKEQQN